MELLSKETPAGRKFTGFLVLLGALLVSLLAVKVAGIGETFYRIFVGGSVGAFTVYCGGNVLKEKVKQNGGSP